MENKNVNLKNAKQDKLFYVVANVWVYRPSDGRCLILKRSEREKVHPGKWCVPGGKLEWKNLDNAFTTGPDDNTPQVNDAIEELLIGEVREEAGLEVAKPFHYLRSVAFVRPDGIPVVLLVFAVNYISGEVKLEQDAFTNYAWITIDEIKNYDCIPDLPQEMLKAVGALSKNKNSR